MPMLEACAYLVDGSMLDMGAVSAAKLRRLEAEGYEGRELINELLTDDWGAPPRFIELIGKDAVGQPLRHVIHYE